MDTPTVPTPPAVAPPVTPPISAARDAANRGSFADFDKAEAAALKGAPLPDVPVTPGKAADISPAPSDISPASGEKSGEKSPPETTQELSKRQQAINDRIRAAVDTATADLRAELARLRQPPTPATPAPALAPDADPDPSDLTKYPEGQFDRKYLADLVDHRVKQALTADSAKRSDQDRQSAVERDLATRRESFSARLTAAQQTDPDVLTKFPPEVVHASPLSFCQPDGRGGLIDPQTNQPTTFANVVTEAAFRSENPVTLLTHLHTHREDAARIAALAPREWLDALTRLDGRLSVEPSPSPAASPTPAAPSTVSAAPPPPPTLSKAGSTTDPQSAAFARNDFRTWDQLETQKEFAKRGRPA